MISGLDSSHEDAAAIEQAFRAWDEKAHVELTPMSPGYSGSRVYKVDVRNPKAKIFQSGKYILKVSPFSAWPDEPAEFDAHNIAYTRNPEFSSAHIPRLIAQFPPNDLSDSNDRYVMLFEIAGRSLDRYAPTDTREDGRFFLCAGSIVSCLIQHWSDDDVSEERNASNILESLCGYRLDPSQAAGLHQFVAEYLSEDIFAVGNEALLNPLKFYELAVQLGFGKSRPLCGLMHGDLHGGNILLNVAKPVDNPFYIIDFALSREGIIGYDAAYLEVSHALAALGDEDVTQIVAALRAAENPSETNPLSGDAQWTKSLITEMRKAVIDWRDNRHGHRCDDIDRQLALCRIAAGINWANKPVPDSWKRAAICYAGWAAREYLRIHESEIWTTIAVPKGKPTASEADDELWSELWAAVKGFDRTQAKYILIAEHLDPSFDLAALGQLPWSAVIDLDPNSDKGGLFHAAAPLLETRRGLHTFSESIPTMDMARGTGWMMAAGWKSKEELFPDLHKWRWERVQTIRDFAKLVGQSASPEPLYAIMLPGAPLDPGNPGARLTAVADALDEATRGRVKLYLLGSRRLSDTAKNLESIAMTPREFVRRVANVFGTSYVVQAAGVPSADGEIRTIPVDILRAMQENVHVLHSTILQDQGEPVRADSDFWRGRPPSWAELHAGLDLQRDIHGTLVKHLDEKLRSHRNQTVIMEHNPGAGGTTAALRAVWDLRLTHPVAILHKYTDALADRVRELFQIAEQPVLLVAEASDLTESDREDLYRYFARNNCRVVLFYIRRTLSKEARFPLNIVGSMPPDEAERFLTSYSELTSDIERVKHLKDITSKAALAQYRSPFFYGLIAFEDEFLALDTYVENHVRHVGRDVREVLEFLGIVTMYSNGGIPLPALKALLDVDVDAPLNLDDLVGEGPARLLIERSGGIRFMHWMIADKVLSHLRGDGDDWRLDLKSYSVGFIRRAVAAAGSEAMRPLFRQMFIDRTEGIDGTEDRGDFAPIIENLDSISDTLGHSVLEVLTEECPLDSHYWAHLGRHQVYRLRRDYTNAEEYLKTAISLDASDPLHHHIFGLVLRSQLRNRLRALTRSGTAETIFAEFNPLFGQASHEFEEARRLSPDNVYGYITHIQLIVLAARELKRVSGVDSIAQVSLADSDIGAWVDENLSLAEELLHDSVQLYATLDRSDSYLTQCEADLDELYGDLDTVVALWEVANARGAGGARHRRALAHAYLARKKRRWSDLQEPELRRIVDLMELNLREAGRREEDYEIWFNASMLLPTFDIDAALEQLSVWAKRYPAWRAHYYIYVLNFMLWWAARSDDLSTYEAALEKCTQKHLGRRGNSPLWYGVSKRGANLVSEFDLGKWTGETGFFSDPSMLCPINGMIEKISGPQSGKILIGGRVSAFFVPGKTFSAHRSENSPVHFFVGFSPSGLRAWTVREGAVEGGDRIENGEGRTDAVFAQAEDPDIAVIEKVDQVQRLRRERAQKFLRDLAAAKARVGAILEVAELELHLNAFMGANGATKWLDDEALEEIIRANRPNGATEASHTSGDLAPAKPSENEPVDERLMGRVVFWDTKRKFGSVQGNDGKKYWFNSERVLPVHRKTCCSTWCPVRFFAGKSDRGPVASGIVPLEVGVLTYQGVLLDEEVLPAVTEFIVSKVAEARSGVLIKDLRALTQRNFQSVIPLLDKLGAKDFSAFVGTVDGLRVSRRGGALMAHPAADEIFSRPHGSKKRPMERKKEGNAPSRSVIRDKELGNLPNIDDIRVVIVDAINKREKIGSSLKRETISKTLSSTYADIQDIPGFLGFGSLNELLQSVRGLKIVGKGKDAILTIKKPTSG